MIRTQRVLIGTREAAKILGCSQPRVRQLVAAGSVWSETVGTLLMLDGDEVKSRAAELSAMRQAGKARGPKPSGFRPN
jgi:excisionase family DNA binding protein